MSELLAIIILGIIEGVTEFLPVSSTGHLLIVENLGWVPHQSDLFNVVIQCGAVLAVLAVFASRVKQMILGWRKPDVADYIKKLLLAFFITGIGGLILKRGGFRLPEEASPVAWATLIGGILILVIEFLLRGKKLKDEIPWSVAIAVGVAQLVAGALPGTSRSAITILTALAMGTSRVKATEFSFLLGIPTLFAAGALEFWQARRQLESGNLLYLFIGTAVATITAFFVVKWLLKFVQTHTFIVFGWYRILLGIVILLLFLSNH